MTQLEIPINLFFLIGLMALAGLAGFLIRSVHIGKKNRRIMELERQMAITDAEILELERQLAEQKKVLEKLKTVSGGFVAEKEEAGEQDDQAKIRKLKIG